ncbi:hypothetical protein [Agromyces albus]|uniref:hypothetical protein n=1 Tax=Agromyces albus TaxID=205332 RepID=UPI0027D8A566|nr:hypothetical protein [Agromyces albus]
MPSTVIWWGVVTAIGGALFITFAPTALNLMMVPNTDQWQSAYVVLDALIQIARTLLAPLGAALIAAGLVMRYLDRRLQGERIADRPRRMRWPDSREEA